MEPMIIHLSGPDSYRRGEKLRELLAEYRKKCSPLDLLTVDLEDEPEAWLRARDFLAQPSMFVESKVLVVLQSGAAPEADGRAWAKILRAQIGTPKTFVIVSDQGGPRKAFAFLVEEAAVRQEFGELEGRVLEVFVRQKLSARHLTLTPDALKFFLGYLASASDRSARATTEIEKLALAGFASPVSLRDLDAAVFWLPREEVFKVTRALLVAGNVGERLTLLEELFARREAAPYIFNSLAYQARGVAAAVLADYDVAVKSGRLEYEEALTGFALGSSALLSA